MSEQVKLPEMPSPWNIIHGTYYYTADQLLAYALQAVKEDRGRIIQACEDEHLVGDGPDHPEDRVYDRAIEDCLEAIRSLPLPE